MSLENEYNPSIEAETLRAELLEGKKYVFERPLLIITATIALLNLPDKSFAPFIPLTTISLLMFNLWFTVNRLKSISRISAYIQIELEEKLYKPWLGWESSLRHYRKWMKLNKKTLKNILEKNIDEESIPDALGFYPTIYLMHIIMVIFSLYSSIWLIKSYPEFNSKFSNVISMLLFIPFCVISYHWRPSVLRNSIEEYRVIWIEIYKNLQLSGIKNK